MFNMQSFLNQFMGFSKNPMQYMMSNKLNIPKQYLNNPQSAIQYLMNTGKLSQEQYNWAVNQANQIQKNPQFMEFLKNNQNGQ